MAQIFKCSTKIQKKEDCPKIRLWKNRAEMLDGLNQWAVGNEDAKADLIKRASAELN